MLLPPRSYSLIRFPPYLGRRYEFCVLFVILLFYTRGFTSLFSFAKKVFLMQSINQG